jgi:Domain of unknown function (DUF5615)
MRFLADENVSRLVIERLQAGGFAVTSIGETRSGAADKDVLEAADAEGCIVSSPRLFASTAEVAPWQGA